VDYVFRWLALRFLPKEDQPETPNGTANGNELEPERRDTLQQRERAVFVAQADAPPCHDCGSIMVRNGACYACVNCGATSGCS
jgi:ribonucleoside-diphosphate reductase alpha chain